MTWKQPENNPKTPEIQPNMKNQITQSWLKPAPIDQSSKQPRKLSFAYPNFQNLEQQYHCFEKFDNTMPTFWTHAFTSHSELVRFKKTETADWTHAFIALCSDCWILVHRNFFSAFFSFFKHFSVVWSHEFRITCERLHSQSRHIVVKLFKNRDRQQNSHLSTDDPYSKTLVPRAV